MRKYSYYAIAGAALAALPSVSRASITLTFGIDSSSFLFSTSTAAGTFTSAMPTGASYNATSNTLTLPSGYNFEFGVTANMVGGTDGTGGTAKTAIGLGAFAFGITDSNSTVAQVDPFGSAINTPVLQTNDVVKFNSDFSNNGVSSAGIPDSDGAGGILANFGVYGYNSVVSTPAKENFAHGTAVDVANTIEVDTQPNSTASPVTTSFALAPDYASDGYVYTSGASYKIGFLSSGTDTVNSPTLNVVINGTASVNSPNHAIVSLTTSTPSGYGSQDGSLTLQPIAPGSYPVATASGFTTATTGYVAVSGFDSGDTEIYALKLNVSGGTPTTAQLNQIISDINSGTTGGTAAAGVTASLVQGIYSSLFPGYNLLLTTTSGVSPADTDLAFDFSSNADSDSALGPVTVAGVAAVPEPATAAGVVLGAAGLLLGRRRKLSSIA